MNAWNATGAPYRRMVRFLSTLAALGLTSPAALSGVIIEPKGNEISRADYYADFALTCSNTTCSKSSDLTPANKRIEIEWVSCRAIVTSATIPEMHYANIEIYNPGLTRRHQLVFAPKIKFPGANTYVWIVSQPAPLASSAGTRYKVSTGFTNIDHVSGGVYCNVSGEIVTLQPPPT